LSVLVTFLIAGRSAVKIKGKLFKTYIK
jgi:hypothetical protein